MQGNQQTYLLLITLSLLLLFNTVLGQNNPEKAANELYSQKNYIEALHLYKQLLKRSPENLKYNYKLGICYLNTNIDRSKAIPYLEKVLHKDDAPDPVLFCDLGSAYQYAYRFEEAARMFKRCKEGIRRAEAKLVDRKIENCHTAKELIKTPLDITFKNAGPAVNTKYPDYYPMATKDGSQIVFTSRRKGNIGNRLEFDGFYSSDIWVTKQKNKAFEQAENAGFLINSEFDEQAVGISNDGQMLFVYVDKIDEFGDIYISKKGRKSFERLEKMGEAVNSDEIETAASISDDGNTLFYASNRKGGYGGLDLYMTRKLPNGEWAKPQNLGPNINTPYNEDFPSLSPDGKTLYFSSEGHASMGGYDLFKSTWTPETNTWSVAQNLGYPINTPYDNRTISFIKDGKQAYVTAVRKEGMGDLDIYKVTFNEKVQNQVVYRLQIPSSDTSSAFITDAFVTITDSTGELSGDYQANLNNGTYTIILGPGTYQLTVDATGYKFYSEEMTVGKAEIKKGIIHKKVKLKN